MTDTLILRGMRVNGRILFKPHRRLALTWTAQDTLRLTWHQNNLTSATYSHMEWLLRQLMKLVATPPPWQWVSLREDTHTPLVFLASLGDSLGCEGNDGDLRAEFFLTLTVPPQPPLLRRRWPPPVATMGELSL